MPSIAVVVPTYNRAGFICEAIDSILAQTSPADEIIVVDDGSTDDTLAVLAGYGDRITVVSQTNAGASAARNTGGFAARSDWLTFLDSDDLWYPERLALLRADLQQQDNGTISTHVANLRMTGHGSDAQFFSVAGIDVPPGRCDLVRRPLAMFLHAFFLMGAAVRRDLFVRLGGFNTDFKVDEDSELAHRLAHDGPFLVRGDIVGDVIRRKADDGALSLLRAKNPWMSSDLKLRLYRNILERGADPRDAALVQAALSHALLQRAGLMRREGRSGYLKTVLDAARTHPSTLKGYVRAAQSVIRNHPDLGHSPVNRTVG